MTTRTLVIIVYISKRVTPDFFFSSGQEGRVGMAAVALRDGQEFDSAQVFKHVENLLPSYARPRFLRIQVCLLQASNIFTKHFENSAFVWEAFFNFPLNNCL